MTNLEALKSMIEFGYSNDNLFTKILTDNDVTSSDTYTSDDQKSLDMCLADLYLYLAQHPDLREGGLGLKWTPEALLRARRLLFAKHGLQAPEMSSRPATVDGTQIW